MLQSSDTGARRRGFSPAAATRHSQSARVHTESFRDTFFLGFFLKHIRALRVCLYGQSASKFFPFFVSCFFMILHFFPKFLEFLYNHLCCHFPDFQDWPVLTARAVHVSHDITAPRASVNHTRFAREVHVYMEGVNTRTNTHT